MKPLEKLRPRTIEMAQGRVLEIGVGSGLNLPHYQNIDALVGIEPDPEMLELAKQRAQGLPFSVELVEAKAEMLPFEDHSFDAVVVTWVFCTIPDADQAAREIARVLRPDGKLLYIEHTRSPSPVMSRLQRLVSPLWQRVASGCRLTREPYDIFSQAGFHHTFFKGIHTAAWNPFPIYAGVATLQEQSSKSSDAQ